MAARPALSSLLSLQASVCSRAALQTIRPRAGKITLSAALSQPRTSAPRCLTCSARALNVNENSTEGAQVKNTNENPPDDVESRPLFSETTASSTSAEESSSDTPWYLQVEPPTHPQKHEPEPLPPLPAGAPELLEPVMKYVYEEMGLDDLDLLDLRDFDPPPALGQNLLMLFGTARSERHLHVASGRFVRWLRYNYKVEADADGLIGAGELRTKLRRMRRKAKLLGTSSIPKPGGDDGITTGWICINLGSLGGEKAEAARFDESGQLSGFGNAAPATGSTIVIQVMTEARRAELNLEKLWRDSLARNQRQRETMSSAPPRLDKGSRGDTKQSTGSGGGGKPEKLHPFFEQRRSYSTTTSFGKREMPGTSIFGNTLGGAPVKPAAPSKQQETKKGLNDIRQKILAFQQGLPVNNNHTEPAVAGQRRDGVDSGLFQEIFTITSDKGFAEEQISLAEDVLRILHERGVSLLNRDVLAPLIKAIASSKSQSLRLSEARVNLEALLRESRICPKTEHLIGLMWAYAKEGLWDRFWDVWRLPPRYQQSRPPALYVALFRILAASRDTEQCLRGVRDCVSTMAMERPAVFPEDLIYEPLLECIGRLDSRAESDANSIMMGTRIVPTSFLESRSVSEGQYRRRAESEFVKMIVGLLQARDLMAMQRAGQRMRRTVSEQGIPPTVFEQEMQTAVSEQGMPPIEDNTV